MDMQPGKLCSGLEDSKISGLSSIKEEQLKLTTCQLSERLHLSQRSMSHRLKEIENLTETPVLWIEHKHLKYRKDLGRGSFGYVQNRMWVLKDKEVAVKYVSAYLRGAFEYEVRMIAYLQHPLVVRFIGCSYDDEEKVGLLVMELMQQNLRSLIDAKKRENGPPFDLPVAVDIMAKIAEGMEYIHERKVTHRDLKSSNVLVNKLKGKEEYDVKIADFGLAIMQGMTNTPYSTTSGVGATTSMSCSMTYDAIDVGATIWRAPEVFKHAACQSYSYSADVWSYGMTCFEILSGEVPFEGVPLANIRHHVLLGWRPELPASICPGALKSMLARCWALVPYERPSFSDIRKTLNLYLRTTTSRDFHDYRQKIIRPQELRRHET